MAAELHCLNGYHMLSINRILCAVGFSAFSLDGLRHGVALARWYGAELTLFHASEPAPSLLPIKGLPGNIPLAAPIKVDEIVVQGRTAVDRLVFGSTTHRVIREAGCPVLTLHDGTIDASRGLAAPGAVTDAETFEGA